MSENADRKIKTYVLCMLVSLAIYMCFISQGLGSNNLIYGIGQIHAYDNTVFEGNVYIADEVISPRYFLDKLFSFCMKINGGNWEKTAVFFVYLGVAVLSAASANLAFAISDCGQILYSVMFSLYFAHSVCRQVGAFGTFDIVSIGMGTGYAFSALAISFSVGKFRNYNAGWIILAIALLFHVHEGIYGFAVVFLLFLTDCFFKKKVLRNGFCGMILYICVLCAVTFPNLISDIINIPDEEFIYIYALVRHPHHLAPSTWNRNEILYSFLRILFPVLFLSEYLYIYNREKLKRFAVEAGLFTAAWAGAILTTHIGVERLQIPAAATLYITKFLKYVAVMAIIWYVKTIKSYFDRKEYTTGFIIFLFPYFSCVWGWQYVTALCLCFLAIIYVKKNSMTGQASHAYPVLLGCVCVATVFWGPAYGMVSNLKFVLGITAGVLIGEWLWRTTRKRLYKMATCGMVILLMAGGAYGRFYQIKDGKVSVITSEQVMLATFEEKIGRAHV